MSTNVNANVLKNFIVKTIGADKLTKQEAQKYNIDEDKFDEANVIDVNNYLELDELLGDDDLYAQFATMYVQEQEQKTEAKNEDQQKEDETKIKDKNEAGV